MANELDLTKLRYEGFEARPVYDSTSDSLFFYWEDAEYFADRIDGVLTVYRALEDDRIVGVQIKDLKRVLAESPVKYAYKVDSALAVLIESTRLYARSPFKRYRQVLAEAGSRVFRLPEELRDLVA